MADGKTEQGAATLSSLLDKLPDSASISHYYTMPMDDWVELLVKDWLVPNLRPFFQAIQWPVNQVLTGLDAFLNTIPFVAFLIVAGLIAWRFAGRGVGIFTLIALSFIDMIGIWSETMTTFAMVLTALIFCAVVGVPLGIAAARSDRFATILRPILDVMQTIPPFVYLVPIVMLFGVGIVPGVIATIVFALPPIIRLTNLGIRQVQKEMVEAGTAFGANDLQILFEIQIPLALKTIMAGLNQTLMLALSMVVIAALIGAGGLGLTVNTGLGRLDVGLAFIGGLGVALMAIILDRITQALGDPSGNAGADWTFGGVIRMLLGRDKQARAGAPGASAPAR